MSLRFTARFAVLALSLCGLAACHSSRPPAASQGAEASRGAASATAPVAAIEPIQGGTRLKALSCEDEVGATAAEARARVCRSVSPATHPPCNIANSCAMIEDEIARSCALFDGPGEPLAGCGADPKSGQAAADVVRRYYSALNARDYDTAWLQWGENGPPNQNRSRFEAGFTHTRSTHVTIGRLEPAEGGAGSIYQTVPVAVDATLDDGTHQTFSGDYIVRRVNGVDGASAAQLRWHIDSAHLKTVR